jgi:predicted transcriptional regulator
MTRQLPPDIELLVNAQLATGQYATASDVLRDAMQSLVERQAVADDLQASLADIEAGRVLPLEEVVVDIRQRHRP